LNKSVPVESYNSEITRKFSYFIPNFLNVLRPTITASANGLTSPCSSAVDQQADEAGNIIACLQEALE